MPEWRKQTEIERKHLAAKLRRAREAAGLNQRDVAERLGIGSHSIVSELENGQRRLDVVELIVLAELYGKDPAWFLRPDLTPADGGAIEMRTAADPGLG